MDAGTVAIIVALVGGPTGGVFVTKYVRPRASVVERLDDLEHDFKMLQDYTHELRQHIADGNPPPPPPWPPGLLQ